jgi:SAM-dependent methyltransferase
MSQATEVREAVSQAYAKAVTETGCGCGCGGREQKGVAAKVAGYSRGELQDLPADAVVNSFGCGNPLAFSDVKEGEVVVDLGSGAGIDLLLAAKKVGPSGRVIGIDMTDEMIARARENAAKAGLDNVEVRKGLIEALPIESNSVDWVISNCVINLSPEKEKVFAEIARVLKPGGRMRVSDIVVEELPEELRGNQALHNSCIAGAISEADYLAGLRAAGLADVEVSNRLVYDAVQIEALAKSELDESSACCGAEDAAGLVEKIKQTLSGKVWSANVEARKPGA